MKKTVETLLGMIIFVALVFLSSAGADFKKTKIAVLDFQLHGEHYETADMGKIVAEWLITALVKEGRFDVIERRLLEKVLSEQKLGASGLIDEHYASKLGKVLGAKVVVTGSLMKIQNLIEVNARIIDVETGAVVAAEIVRSTSAAKLEDLVTQMAEKIIKDFPLEGYIVKREGDGVLVDLGRRNGVKKGMRFIVYREGNIIKHPKTGEILDIERIETGTIEITSLNEKTASASILSEVSPDAVVYGQLVKSMKEATAETAAPQRAPRSEAVKREKVRKSRGRARAGTEDIEAVNADIEEMKQMRKNGNAAWKQKSRDILISLKTVSKTHKKTPEAALLHAKYYAAIDSVADAETYVKQALKYARNPADVYIFEGDMYLDVSERKKGYAKDAVKAYERAASSSRDKGLQAEMYLQIGDVFMDVLEKQDKAEEFWKKAAHADPGGESAQSAKERLAGIKR